MRLLTMFGWLALAPLAGFALAGSAPARNPNSDRKEAVRLLNEAVPLVEATSNAATRDSALRELAVVFSRAHLKCAREYVDKIQTGSERDRAWNEIASSLAGRDTGAALKVARNIQNDMERSHTLAFIAGNAAKTDPSRALAIADAIVEPRDRTEGYFRIVQALSGMKPELAVSIAEKIESPDYRARAFTAIANALADSDEPRALALYQRAADAATYATDFGQDAWNLREIAKGMKDIDPDRALALLERSASLSMNEKAVSLRAYALGMTAAEMGDLSREKALATFNTAITEAGRLPEIQDEPVALYCCGPGAAAAVAKQRKATTDFDHGRGRPGTLHLILPLLARVEMDRAIEVAHSLGIPVYRSSALASIAQVVGKTDPPRALAILSNVGDPADRVRALIAMAKDIELNDPAKAAQLLHAASEDAARIQDPKDRENAYRQVAGAFALPDYRAGLIILKNVSDPLWRSGALYRMAMDLAPFRPQAAIDIAGMIARPEGRGLALVAIARSARGLNTRQQNALITEAEEIARRTDSVSLRIGIATTLLDRADAQPGLSPDFW